MKFVIGAAVIGLFLSAPCSDASVPAASAKHHVVAHRTLAKKTEPRMLGGMPLYKNASAPIAARVDDLLARMTLEEKVDQMLCVWNQKVDMFDANYQFDPAKASKLFPNGFGLFARPSDLKGAGVAPGRGPRATVELVNAVQHWAIEDTRLGIPVLFHEEALHGYVAPDATSFPQAIAEASTWDPELITQIDSVAAREAAVRGVSQVLAPVVDVVRDPRWGRTEETFGEDPYLVSRMGVAAIKGYQGNKLPLAPGKVFATLKHFTGHGWPENGINVGPANIGERTLREIFFPPFEAAVRETNIRNLMASYNEIDGVPSHENYWLLHDVLRGEWGFKGAVNSDYDGIEQLADLHHVAANYADAAIEALHAGVDEDLPDGDAYKTLVAAVHTGKVPVSEIDDSVRRILTMKFEAGLFERPYANADKAEALTDSADADALALKAAQKAVILLKNDGTLPLDASKIKTLAVIGPNAAAVHLGGYSNKPRREISILQGIQLLTGDKVKVVYSEGVKITKDDVWAQDEDELADPKKNEERIADAVKVAQDADEIVLVIGGNEMTSREAWANSHLGDRDNLKLVGQQEELADAMFALGKPVIVVLINGRPLAVDEISQKANALIEGWYLGQETGTAMADVLFGNTNPGGKLPITIPRSVGQLPMFYDYKPSARRGYLWGTTEPLYPFGWGLSYTTFDISAPVLSSKTIKIDGSVDVSVNVTNTGTRAGDEVVQLYIHDLVSSTTTPVKELKGFKRVTLNPGETRTVTFTLTPRQLSFWNMQMKRVVEPGDFDIMAGPNSVDLKKAVLTVTR
ncbi:MAG: glycoside hydrolase family 3 C-terminal domain-containing protein [Alphaproteobacteria bacterium]|nr:glycoside hydrolase family 3 C-terminal domain-containing protein [Alphaproteobacteria bacterium]MDE2110172.1 glycoside hydrolase family 3 C-terminal domain-containing protein [Alphaproteobacteria bacterium]MDE2492506.1 glycoside hydrolase family 3 C-terminal domain-containing protein [Alphaproteobacteria bacterium]